MKARESFHELLMLILGAITIGCLFPTLHHDTIETLDHPQTFCNSAFCLVNLHSPGHDQWKKTVDPLPGPKEGGDGGETENGEEQEEA
jgi:hypothetical protein